MPAGIETNDRTTGVRRPSSTAQSSQRRNQASARSSLSWSRWSQRPCRSRYGPAAAAADLPADHGADQVAERAGERDREVRGEARRERVAEQRHRLPRDRARGDRAAVDHHDLARGREDRVDQHQEEDGVEAVVADRARDRVGDAAEDGEQHRRGDSTARAARVPRPETTSGRRCAGRGRRASARSSRARSSPRPGRRTAALDRLALPVEAVPDEGAGAPAGRSAAQRSHDLAGTASRR